MLIWFLSQCSIIPWKSITNEYAFKDYDVAVQYKIFLNSSSLNVWIIVTLWLFFRKWSKTIWPRVWTPCNSIVAWYCLLLPMHFSGNKNTAVKNASHGMNVGQFRYEILSILFNNCMFLQSTSANTLNLHSLKKVKLNQCLVWILHKLRSYQWYAYTLFRATFPRKNSYWTI